MPSPRRTIAVHRSRPALLTVLVGVALAGLVGSGLVAPAQAAAMPSKQQWWDDVTTVLRPATAVLDDRVARRQPGEKLAINLDIDNTSIETYYYWPRPTPQVLRLAQHLRAKGVAVLFNTGRPTSDLPRVRKVLTAAGYRYSSVCAHRSGVSITAGKQICRRYFLSKGYTLIANIGNNATDFAGAPVAEHGYRLPDYGGRLS